MFCFSLKAAFVRLRGQWDGAVEVRLCAVKSRAVVNRKCVAAMRGGEHWDENDQSVTQGVPEDSRHELDLVGVICAVNRLLRRKVAVSRFDRAAFPGRLPNLDAASQRGMLALVSRIRSQSSDHHTGPNGRASLSVVDDLAISRHTINS